MIGDLVTNQEQVPSIHDVPSLGEIGEIEGLNLAKTMRALNKRVCDLLRVGDDDAAAKLTRELRQLLALGQNERKISPKRRRRYEENVDPTGDTATSVFEAFPVPSVVEPGHQNESKVIGGLPLASVPGKVEAGIQADAS